MGCDIHCQVEWQDKKGNWHWLLEGLRPEVSTWKTNPVELGRNYLLFAILAGVRDEWGIKPIQFERGFPDDLSPELAEVAEYSQSDKQDENHPWNFGDHSFGHIYEKELADFNWAEKPMGYIDLDSWQRYRAYEKAHPKGTPINSDNEMDWTGILNPERRADCKVVSPIIADALITGVAKKKKNLHYMVPMRWTKSYEQCVYHDYMYTLKNLRTTCMEYPSEKVVKDMRIVFGFDS